MMCAFVYVSACLQFAESDTRKISSFPFARCEMRVRAVCCVRKDIKVKKDESELYLLNFDSLKASAVLITSTYACNSKRLAVTFKL